MTVSSFAVSSRDITGNGCFATRCWRKCEPAFLGQRSYTHKYVVMEQGLDTWCAACFFVNLAPRSPFSWIFTMLWRSQELHFPIDPPQLAFSCSVLRLRNCKNLESEEEDCPAGGSNIHELCGGEQGGPRDYLRGSGDVLQWHRKLQRDWVASRL